MDDWRLHWIGFETKTPTRAYVSSLYSAASAGSPAGSMQESNSYLFYSHTFSCLTVKYIQNIEHIIVVCYVFSSPFRRTCRAANGSVSSCSSQKADKLTAPGGMNSSLSGSPLRLAAGPRPPSDPSPPRPPSGLPGPTGSNLAPGGAPIGGR